MTETRLKPSPLLASDQKPSAPRAPYIRGAVGRRQLNETGRNGTTPSVVAYAPIGSTAVSVFQVRDNPPGSYFDPARPDFLLQLAEGGAGTGRSDMGSGFFTTAWRRGTMLLAAPDESVGCEAHCDFDLSALALPRTLLDRAWEEFGNDARPVDTGALHEQAFGDPLIFDLGLKLVDEAIQGNPGGPLYADSLAYIISANLLRLAGEIQGPQAEARPLDPLSLGRVIDDMEDRLADRISMTELATLLDMNVYGFSRAFRAATNMSPHQFLTDRRITRVKELLEHTDEPLVAIAMDCGFSSQSHMTAAFRKHEGMPPGAWRRARRG